MKISDLMQSSGVGFGTSGARGLVSAMTDEVCYAYTLGFLSYLYNTRVGVVDNNFGPLGKVAVAGDLRPSTPRIISAVFQAIRDFGLEPINCGMIPSSAVALYGIAHAVPAIMVTGSHIPDDRNGIKFNLPTGEILKEDEAGIKRQEVEIPSGMVDDNGAFVSSPDNPAVDFAAEQEYMARFHSVFGPEVLAGLRVGVYQHSGVAREILPRLLEGMGVEVIRLGFSETFVPVDTEAIREEDVKLAKAWSAEHHLDAIVSTDGDADRPLVSDEQGNWLRGDIAGILTADFLGAQHLATPVSCNTAVEKTGHFQTVLRTRIGSPFVIAAMNELQAEGKKGIVGYEANGGFLLADRFAVGNGALAPLPTRDAVIVILAILLLSRREELPISELVSRLPQRFTFSNRVKECPTEVSHRQIERLSAKTGDGRYPGIERFLGSDFGGIKGVDQTDGLRITLDNDEIIHLRPSGNAPELRCYTEAGSEDRAREINQQVMALVKRWV